jgi:hypothetical protein
LSEQLRGRTFACLDAVQREQFLAETAGQAERGYRTCMAALAGVTTTD